MNVFLTMGLCAMLAACGLPPPGHPSGCTWDERRSADIDWGWKDRCDTLDQARARFKKGSIQQGGEVEGAALPGQGAALPGH